MEDIDILNGIKEKREDCYKELLNKYTKYVAAIISKIAGNRLNKYDIEEICADILIKIWDNSYKITLLNGSMKSYIGVVTRNHTINILRKKSDCFELPLTEEIHSYSSNENLDSLENRIEIKDVINNIDKLDREIFIRRYFYLERVKDIALSKNMNERTVSSKLCRIKQKIKSNLSERGIM